MMRLQRPCAPKEDMSAAFADSIIVNAKVRSNAHSTIAFQRLKLHEIFKPHDKTGELGGFAYSEQDARHVRPTIP